MKPRGCFPNTKEGWEKYERQFVIKEIVEDAIDFTIIEFTKHSDDFCCIDGDDFDNFKKTLVNRIIDYLEER